MATLTIFGAGSWGTAIAHTAAGAGHDVALWCRRDALARQINNTGRNTDYLPDMTIPPESRRRRTWPRLPGSAHSGFSPCPLR